MKLLLYFLLIFWSSGLMAQNTLGVLTYDAFQTYEGYTLIFPTHDTNTYLIDNCGRVVHQWVNNYYPGQVVFLLEDGNLLRTYSKGTTSNPTFSAGGGSDGIQLIDWNGTILWDYVLSDSAQRMHHDVCRMTNGHILIHAWEIKSKTEVAAAGYDVSKLPMSNVLWPEKILEVEPYGTDSGIIVWEWHMWDHLVQEFKSSAANYGVVASHPELIDINYIQGDEDFLHINSIDYNSALDQIILSVHTYDEVWIIDHSTTTAEAATHSGGKSGKGGDLLYRWGNPATYDAGAVSDKKMFGQHNAHWIPTGLSDEGKILFFNNGIGRKDGYYSSVEIFVPPFDSSTNQYHNISGLAYEPDSSEWIYTADPKENFYSKNISGVQRLANGNTLICSGANGTLFEITPAKEVVWKYIVPLAEGIPYAQGQTISGSLNSTFRCYRYGEDYAGLQGKTLTPGNYIELNPDTSLCVMASASIVSQESQEWSIEVFPNPARDILYITSIREMNSVLLVDKLGRTVYKNVNPSLDLEIKVAHFKKGIYLLKVDHNLFKIIVI